MRHMRHSCVLYDTDHFADMNQTDEGGGCIDLHPAELHQPL